MLSVCSTSLFDRTRKESDPLRFIESREIPFLTMGIRQNFRATGIRLGDLATIVHPRTGKSCHGLVGDMREVRGVEPSLHISQKLKLHSGEPAIYLVHPESGLGQGIIPSCEEINRRSERLWHQAGNFGESSWAGILADYFGDLLQADISSV